MLLCALLLASTARATEVRGHIDWQGHPAMHLTWGFFDPGLTDAVPRRRTWRHQFKQTVYTPWLDDSGVRIFLTAAMAAERARDPVQARQLILDELAYVEAFAAANPGYAVAHTPEAARQLLANTDLTVLVHSIEGGHLLLSGPEDARFWAEQGVALITVMHLRDDELGGAGINPGALGPIVNRAGARARRRGERRGLTDRGRAAVVELADAGILVDLSHMTPAAVDDALEVTAAHGIPPVITHGKLASIQDTERAISTEQLVEIYRQGGTFNLGLSGRMLDPVDATLPIPDDICWGTLESFAFHYGAVRDVLAAHTEDIFGPGAEDLDEAQRTALSVGWSSDWNGWVSHSEPTKGCRDEVEPLPIDTLGLAHPGLLPQHWQRLEERGTDLDPMLRSAERFLQLWEQVRARSAG